MIATLGLAIVLNSGVEGFFGAENLRLPVEVLPVETLSLGGDADYLA